MGENWVAPDTPRRRLKAINALLASIFFDLIAFHKMKKCVQTLAWLFAVLLALQNFQNLQQAYQLKKTCLASSPSSSASAAASPRPDAFFKLG